VTLQARTNLRQYVKLSLFREVLPFVPKSFWDKPAADGLTFHPCSGMLCGNRSLTNFTYRKAVLDIEMQDYGNQVKAFTIDGKSSHIHLFLAVYRVKYHTP